jgi:hypothetical protein
VLSNARITFSINGSAQWYHPVSYSLTWITVLYGILIWSTELSECSSKNKYESACKMYCTVQTAITYTIELSNCLKYDYFESLPCVGAFSSRYAFFMIISGHYLAK